MPVNPLYFNRDVVVTVDGNQISSRLANQPNKSSTNATLSVQFKIENDIETGIPNKATLNIHNLAKDKRSKLSDSDLVTIEAGYVQNRHLLFRGNISVTSSTRQGSEWVTMIQAGDGLAEHKQARINKSFGAGAGIAQVIKEVAKTFGIGLGNLETTLAPGVFRGGLSQLSNGAVLSGRSATIMDQLCESAGLSWSIQSGELVLLSDQAVTSDVEFALTSESGLVGSPEAGEKGIVKVRSLLNGALSPGRAVTINALEISGRFKINKVVHTGDTAATEWYTDLEATRL